MNVVDLLEALGRVVDGLNYDFDEEPSELPIEIVFERLVGEEIQESPPFTIDNVDEVDGVIEIRCQEKTDAAAASR